MTEHITTVAGVAVDTRHWIGGERVASVETFTDVSPIDGSTLGEISRGTATEAAAAVAAARAAFPAWAATSRAERARILHAIADGVEKRIEDLANVETLDNGALLRSHRRGVMPRVAHNFRFFADWLLKLEHRGLRHSRPHQPRELGPGGPVRADHAVERPADAGHLEGRPGAGRREHGDPQARRVVPAHCFAARRHRGRGRAAGRCPQRRAGIRHRGRQRSRLAPGRPPDQLHRFRAHRPAHRPGGRRQPHPSQPRTRRKVTAVGLRRRGPRPRRGPGGGAVRQRRTGMPGRDPHPCRGDGLGRVHPPVRGKGEPAQAG